ncbi:uncharacterized protein si:dkey-106l3.7 [Mugil cephalus]|uniref:uncharacterized protein si:dkey-106l3.7 n=1 Tax=Mugil cephalus TaxID=48193 RepID=UPI001FB833FC|nr:uncharacterized protein si:dkey-106l3.7 [Mugil cephalus]
MNLYRSFGNLMEAWVTEESVCPDSDCPGNKATEPLTPSSDMETNLRSESVDSGVETASCDMSIPAASHSLSTDNSEMDLFTPQGEGLSPASTSLSPVPSSTSSPHLGPSRAEEDSPAVHKVEETLKRTQSQLLKDNAKPPTVEEVLRRRPRASFQPKRHTSQLLRGERLESFGVRRTANPSVPIRHMSEIYRRPLSESCDRHRSESFDVKESKTLSPGLSYLEAVCQMLEEIARKQMQSRELYVETDALCLHQDVQSSDTCQSDSTIVEEDFRPCLPLQSTENAESTDYKPQRPKNKHLRMKSASETNLSTLHLKRFNSDCRGQHLSTVDLMEKDEEDHELQLQKLEKKETNKSNWRSKLSSLRRDMSFVSNTKSLQTQPSEKNSARRRWSQLFKRRGKSVPG